MSRRILFRCDAGAAPELGTGHLVRDLLLASSLRERGATVSLCGRYDQRALDRIQSAGFPVERALADERDSELLHRAVVRHQPEVLVVDHLDTEVEEMAGVRDLVPVIATFDDLGPGRAVADMVINAIVGNGDPYSNYEYVVLPPPEPKSVDTPGRKRIVVSVGGQDHRGMGPALASGLTRCVDADVALIAAGGHEPGGLDGVTLVADPRSFSAELRSADIVVANGGLTLLEALANGIPAVAVPQHAHQATTVDRLARRGAVLGDANLLDKPAEEVVEEVCAAVSTLVEDEAARRALRRHALETIDGGGLGRVVRLLMVVERLDWDSDFFGVEIARLSPARVTERMLSFALARCEEMGTDCLYHLCDCHHAESVRLVEAAGFHFVDMRLTFERPVPSDAQAGRDIRDATPADLPTLERIAADSYVDSRYWFDQQFPRADCQRVYANWIDKCVSGDQAERTFVLDPSGNGPIGYIAVARLSAVVASIVLVGVDETARGVGAGTALIEHALSWARDCGCSTIEVVTQGRNYQAQRIYQHAGFVTKKTELWYHLWRR
ncbi:MAG: GNAT family N-acetyltransferase [Candidatus Limnocylindria bacterium]